MKITNVRACQPVTPDCPPDWRLDLGQILIAIDTDLGMTGYGVGGGGWAGIHVVQTVLRDMLLNRDPTDISGLWDIMFRGTLAYGQKGLAIMALSGVDLALWDLRGIAEQRPVYELLGGGHTQDIPTYVTVWNREALQQAVDEGHRGYKLHLEKFGNVSLDQADSDFAQEIESQVAWARSIVGDENELMADAWMRWDLAKSLAVVEQLSALRLGWLEEPMPINDEAGYAKLMQQSPVPIAGGEHEYTSAAFQHLADFRLHNVLQPDVCWVGGLTELIRIYAIGRRHELRVCPHRGSEVWSLHALAALDPDPLAESGRTWMQWVEAQPPIADGRIRLTDRPGLGHGIDEAKLRIFPPPTCRW